MLEIGANTRNTLDRELLPQVTLALSLTLTLIITLPQAANPAAGC